MNLIKPSVAFVVVLLAASTVPFGTAQLPDEIPMTTLVDVPLETVYSESFDGDDGNWTANEPGPAEPRPDPVSSWEWGAPTSGPGFAASGSNVWATNLDGQYGGRECAAIMSPPIDLDGASSASISFKHWIHTQQGSTGSRFLVDGGSLFVTSDGGETLSVLEADGGYAGPLNSALVDCHDESPYPETMGFGGPPSSSPPPAVYEEVTADLSGLTGTVQVLIAFGSSCCTHRDGWYVDDFTVTLDDVPTVEDFEVDDGGFTIVSTARGPEPPLGWDHGVPGEGPDSDSPMWGTNVAGDYRHKECAWVESPEITLGVIPGAVGGLVTANLTWDHWYRSNSLYAAGIVQVGVAGDNGTEYQYVTPTDGYPGKATGTYEDQLHACLGKESADGAYSGIHDREGNPMKSQEVDLTPFLGQTITVRFFFASAWSTFNPSVYPGWYVDNVQVQTALTPMGPDVPQLAEDTVPSPGQGVSVQAPGWTTGGDASSWEYGLVAPDEGEGGPDGEFAYATNLTGAHHEDECSWIDSPAIPGAVLSSDPTLTISHWFHQYHSSFSGTAWNGGVILASTDGGTTWTYVASDAYTSPSSFSGLEDCVESVDPDAPSDIPSFSGEQEFFNEVSIDLAAFAEADTVQLRFMQASGIGIERPGWYIESIDVGGLSLLPPL